MTTAATALDRGALAEWYRRNRQRSRQLFDLVRPEAYHVRPISLRHPVVFYEGHLPAFSLNTLVKKGLGRPGVDEKLERLFARGIDPEDEAAARTSGRTEWPSREGVQRFADACDALVLDALATAPIEQPGHPLLHEAQAAYAILEHETMHQETMIYMWHQLPYEQKLAPADAAADTAGTTPAPARVVVPAGRATLGTKPGERPFAWDNEVPGLVVDVPAFEIDVHDVTNEQFMAFVDAGGYRQPEWWSAEALAWLRGEGIEHPRFWARRSGSWKWRGMFEEIDLPPAWPVYVSQAEAAAYARWSGARLATEAEYHRAAFGDASGRERQYPWGEARPDASRGLFGFRSWDPVAVGRHPAGQSAWGVHDLMGNGWEWTSTEFAPFDGFRAMPSYPEYSADFFDGQHLVMKGASPATDAALLRRSFRNWFRPTYPFVYATFRCVRPVS
ncbi:MAG: SUMF1/EgtB/PvdO family nonheme iron enzyme [Vicinamibacteraceae bacterium]